MSKVQADFLQECMTDPALVSGPVPIDAFTREICLVCMNRACSRAGTNNMAFDRRAINWRKDLFEHIPRAQDNDPNFNSIRAKRFLPVANKITLPGSPVFISPDPAPVNPPVVQETPPIVVEPKSEAVAPEPLPSPAPSPATPTPNPSQPQPQPQPQPQMAQLGNTPFQQGVMLPGAKPTKEVVVQPGSTFTFGEEDE